MDILWIVAVALALGADAFSLSLALGLSGIRKSMAVRLALLVGIFHVLMPLSGMFVGQILGVMLGRYAAWLGALVLIWLGGRMIYRVYRPEQEVFSFSEARKVCFSHASLNGAQNTTLRGLGIYLLAFSVSLDALSVGVTLGTVRADLLVAVVIIGLVAGLMTGLGLILGRIMGTRLGTRAEFCGGVALLLIGVKLIF